MVPHTAIFSFIYLINLFIHVALSIQSVILRQILEDHLPRGLKRHAMIPHTGMSTGMAPQWGSQRREPPRS